MSYYPVKTADGLEIRDEEGNVVWGPREDYSWPPNREMAEAVISDANIEGPTKSVLQLLVGNIDIKTEQS
jgi:hypothetical protein